MLIAYLLISQFKMISMVSLTFASTSIDKIHVPLLCYQCCIFQFRSIIYNGTYAITTVHVYTGRPYQNASGFYTEDGKHILLSYF